jgi:folate-dependent phosphoribosylglycinamide formyltransferase PurN
VRTLRLPNVNDAETLDFLEVTSPDLVLVSSTTLVGRGIIHWAEQRMGILNLHTGLSPYLNGGPNCTNWCLAERWFHLIGNTVHWLDTGIDSGPIVTTGRPSLLGTESLAVLQVKVHDHGHALYARALAAIARGVRVPRVPQASVGVGRTFLTVEWSPLAMLRAATNHRRYFRPEWFKSEGFAHASSLVSEVPL